MTDSNTQPKDPQQPSRRAPGRIRKWWRRFFLLMHVVGALTSVQAVMSTRTAQGAIAWAVSLNAIPIVAVPAYWVLGQSKFDGYTMINLQEYLEDSQVLERAKQELKDEGMLLDRTKQTSDQQSQIQLLENLARLPFTRYNSAELLIDGAATFDALVAEMTQAQEYILFQFYIIRDDDLGRRLKDVLVERSQAGVRVHVLYDELGSSLSKAYIQDLRQAGAEIFPFNTTKGRGNRFRLNFRNHRKVVVIDGKVAFLGGHNVGDEYLGLHPKLTPWRDTHVAVRGPIVQCVQVPFAEDWYWATEKKLTLNWHPEKAPEGDAAALCIPTGPADTIETGTLWALHVINSARQRLWIVSPYFVPDEQIISALQLAALRGVDVRILIPENPDHKLVYLSSFSYLEEAETAGVKIFRYQPGFLHQKVMLVDDNVATVGTVNLDNRSMRLNFEITMMLVDPEFAQKVEAMIKDDFSRSRQVSAAEYTERSLPFRFLVRVARLMAPVQ